MRKQPASRPVAASHPGRPPATDAAQPEMNDRRYASIPPAQQAAIDGLLEWFSEVAPVSTDDDGLPIDAKGRYVSLQTEHKPTALSTYHAPRAVEYASTYGPAGHAIHSATLALGSIESISELLTCDALEKDCDQPQLVLSDRQRVALLQGAGLLAGVALHELLNAMERGCKKNKVNGAS